MTRKTVTFLRQRRARLRRSLGYLLLLLITYGVTVEAAQSHRLVARSSRTGIALGDASGPESSEPGKTHPIECPVCQYHQELGSGLVYAPLLLLTPSITITPVVTPPGIHLFTIRIPTSDRAPPFGRA